MWNAGCFTSAVACALNNFGHQIDPGQLNDQLNYDDGYDAEGLLKWDVLEKLFPDVVLADSFTTTLSKASSSKVEMNSALARIITAVKKGIPVMVTVDVPNVGIPGVVDHIVTLKYAPDSLEGWLVNDSDGGHEIELKAGGKYGTPEQAIFGARVLVGSPTGFPDYSTAEDKAYGQGLAKAAQVMRGRNIAVYSKEIVDSFLGK